MGMTFMLCYGAACGLVMFFPFVFYKCVMKDRECWPGQFNHIEKFCLGVFFFGLFLATLIALSGTLAVYAVWLPFAILSFVFLAPLQRCLPDRRRAPIRLLFIELFGSPF